MFLSTVDILYRLYFKSLFSSVKIHILFLICKKINENFQNSLKLHHLLHLDKYNMIIFEDILDDLTAIDSKAKQIAVSDSDKLYEPMDVE